MNIINDDILERAAELAFQDNKAYIDKAAANGIVKCPLCKNPGMVKNHERHIKRCKMATECLCGSRVPSHLKAKHLTGRHHRIMMGKKIFDSMVN